MTHLICQKVDSGNVPEYKCRLAVECTSNADCSAHGLALSCTSGYCQPHTCTATGQCVSQQICSSNYPLPTCVFQDNREVAEGSTNFLLRPSKPIRYGASLSHIQWYKTPNQDQLATYNRDLGIVRYHNEYCEDGKSSCAQSHRASLDTSTAALTIKEVNQQDEDFYYCEYRFRGYLVGQKYEMYLTVFVQPGVPAVGGLDSIIETENEVTLTCTVERIRPAARRIYWKIDGNKLYGTTMNSSHDPIDNSLIQTNIVSLVLRRDQHGKTVECIVVPEYGKKVSTKKLIDFGYSSTEKAKLSMTLVGIIVGVVVIFLVILVVLVTYIVRLKRRKNNLENSNRSNATGSENPALQVADEGDYISLNFDQIRPSDIVETSPENDSIRVSQGSEYLEPVMAPGAPYEQLGNRYANEPIDSGKPYDTLKPSPQTPKLAKVTVKSTSTWPKMGQKGLQAVVVESSAGFIRFSESSGLSKVVNKSPVLSNETYTVF